MRNILIHDYDDVDEATLWWVQSSGGSGQRAGVGGGVGAAGRAGV